MLKEMRDNEEELLLHSTELSKRNHDQRVAHHSPLSYWLKASANEYESDTLIWELSLRGSL
jgi:hypothetical protein